MKKEKLRLVLETLEVESFDTSPLSAKALQGTVYGMLDCSAATGCDSCFIHPCLPPNTCDNTCPNTCGASCATCGVSCATCGVRCPTGPCAES